jgi:acyl-[acyl-carrier-protein]-phospholipid O-acyltransferase / long-chain-fatty-acid--[acyl-carrier-protein] ligase
MSAENLIIVNFPRRAANTPLAPRRRTCETDAMTAIGKGRAKPSGAFSLLAARRFGPLFAAQFLSAFNDNALKNALLLMIAYRADPGSGVSAQILIPLAGGLFILPFFLFSATAGQLADRHDKAWLIRLIKFSEIPVMLIAAAGVLAHATTLLLALLCVMGIGAAAFGPLKYAILPDLLAPGELVLGNALVEGGTYFAILLGTIAGVLIAGRHGAGLVAALIVAVAFAASAFSLAIPPTGAAAPRAPVGWNLFTATARVIGEAAADPVPFRAILGISWFWLAGAVYLTQFPGYVRFTLGGEEVIVTLFLTVFSLGIGLGSLLCNRLLGSRVGARTVPWGALGIGLFSIDLWLASPMPASGSALIGFAAFLAAPGHWRILTDLLGVAVSGGVFILPLYVLLQAATPRRRRAQAIAANNVINAAAMVLSAVAMIALGAAGIGSPGLFLLTGLGTIAVALWSWRILPGFAAVLPRAEIPDPAQR